MKHLRDLAKLFSVRQVSKVLEMIGFSLKESVMGPSPYERGSNPNESFDFLVLLDDLSHHERFGTCLIVEPKLAARGAERATTEDLYALRAPIPAVQE